MPVCNTLDAATETTWRGQGLFGLRGCWAQNSKNYARIVAGVEEPEREILVFDIPSRCLPYLPDMSPGSQFERKGHWHHYPAEESPYEIVTRVIGNQMRVQRVVLDGKPIYDSNRCAD